MRTSFVLVSGLLLGLAQSVAAQAPSPAGPVTYQTFYDALSPYGQWVEDPDYGYAWVPAVGSDFQPYRTSGHWVYTDYGWTWVSDYQWGWAAFHYGRWRYSDAYGWLWVPGYSWGPAWVAWRQSAGYYGWAPLGPPPPRRGGVHLNIGFSFSFGDAPVAPARWCFVPAAYVASPALATYYVPPAQTSVVYNRTTIIHNTYVANNVTNVTNKTVVNQAGPGGRRGQPAFPAGPARADVEKATGQPITPLAVSSRDKPGVGVQGKSLAFYRPEVAAPAPTGSRSSGAEAAPAASPAPRKVVPMAQAARLARRPPADPNRGLLRDNAARHLSSTDTDPIRMAKQQAQAAATGSPGPAVASPRTATPPRPDHPGTTAPAAPVNPNVPAPTAAKQPAKTPPARPATQPAAPQATMLPSPTPQTDHDRHQAHQQAQADRQQKTQQRQAQQQAQTDRQQQQQQQQQAQASRQQQQQAKQAQQQQAQQLAQQQQAKQVQQQARQQQQQVRQQQQQARQEQAHQAQQQARPPHPQGREEHR